MRRNERLKGLGDRIRERRERLGLTVKSLADRVEISRSYLHQLESLQGKSPSAEILYRIAQELHTTIGFLLGFEEHRETDTEGPPLEVNPALQRFARLQGLSEGQIQMLAGIHYHGRQPQTERDWAFLWAAIKRAVMWSE